MFIRRDYDGILSCRMRRKSSRWMNEAYRDYFPIGAALAQYSLDRFGSDLLEHYGSFTPESEMKWNIVHPADGAHKFKLTFENLNNSVSDAAILLRGGGRAVGMLRAITGIIMRRRRYTGPMNRRTVRSLREGLKVNLSREAFALDVNVKVSGNASSEATLSSSDEEIATISSTGKTVLLHAAGTTTITATAVPIRPKQILLYLPSSRSCRRWFPSLFCMKTVLRFRGIFIQ